MNRALVIKSKWRAGVLLLDST